MRPSHCRRCRACPSPSCSGAATTSSPRAHRSSSTPPSRPRRGRIPMTVEMMRETWPGRIQTVTIGATPDDGGTRGSTVTVGGHAALPFRTGDAPTPPPPVVPLQVFDVVPRDWPEHLRAPLADVLGSPADWARKGVEELGVDLICLRLMSVHPEWGDGPPAAAV